MGVPPEKIILEDLSTTKWENIEFTKKLLDERNIIPKRAIVVHSPYLQRRTFLTFKEKWPNLKVSMISPSGTFDDYVDMNHQSKTEIINIMTGEVQRLIEYPKRGWLKRQKIPKKVLDAYNFLISQGFTKAHYKGDS